MLPRILGAGAVLLLLAAGGAKADGLERFDKLIKPEIKTEHLSYRSAKALGDSGFILEDVTITPPPDQTSKAEPVHIKRITVEDLDFASMEKKKPPSHRAVFDWHVTAYIFIGEP